MVSKILLVISKNTKISNVFSQRHNIAVLSLLIGFIITCIVGYYSNNTQKDIAKNLLRLHVIANSNSKEDQDLKLKVRDEIIKEIGGKFSLSDNIDKTKQIAFNNIENIKQIAKEVISKNGKNYAVSVNITNSYFPTKYYGNIALPPGNYDALKVEIGDSKGANWWCVLFPPLCFVDATNGNMSNEAKQKLQSTLSKEEYELITASSSNDNVPVKIKFKSVELWEESKHKVQVAIDTIF